MVDIFGSLETVIHEFASFGCVRIGGRLSARIVVRSGDVAEKVDASFCAQDLSAGHFPILETCTEDANESGYRSVSGAVHAAPSCGD